MSYAAPATPLALAGLPIAVYLPVIYADGFGLSLGIVGLLITLSRFTDVVTDPIIGFVSDKLRTPVGGGANLLFCSERQFTGLACICYLWRPRARALKT